MSGLHSFDTLADDSGSFDTIADESDKCVTANIIHAVKNTPGTTIVGIYVGDQRGDGSRVLHNISSCDSYTFNALDQLACPNTFSAETFDHVLQTIVPTVDSLMLEAQALQGVCEVCKIGFYSPAEGDKCEACPPGTWAHPLKRTECESCPLGFSSVGKDAQKSNCMPMCSSLTGTKLNEVCTGGGYQSALNQDNKKKACSSPACDSDKDRETCCQCKEKYVPSASPDSLICVPTCGSLEGTKGVGDLCNLGGYESALNASNLEEACSSSTCDNDRKKMLPV
jgi:hypothetical protein